jgi:hypothetical protein
MDLTLSLTLLSIRLISANLVFVPIDSEMAATVRKYFQGKNR